MPTKTVQNSTAREHNAAGAILRKSPLTFIWIFFMALTQSTMMPLGAQATDFKLPDTVTGKEISLSSFAPKKLLLVMFICRHCPYVIHIQHELARLGRDYQQTDLAIIAISSNDAENFPQDAPNSLKQFAIEQGFTFPLCYDETQQVAQAFTAACTPDFFLFNADRKLIYRGQLDDSRPGNDKPINGDHLRQAIDAALSDKPIHIEQKPSIGCNIKWKKDNAPAYY
jgi:peroxiredoxin